jgi:hypothetical protein
MCEVFKNIKVQNQTPLFPSHFFSLLAQPSLPRFLSASQAGLFFLPSPLAKAGHRPLLSCSPAPSAAHRSPTMACTTSPLSPTRGPTGPVCQPHPLPPTAAKLHPQHPPAISPASTAPLHLQAHHQGALKHRLHSPPLTPHSFLLIKALP